MANVYCTATNTGKGFVTPGDRDNFYISGHPGNVYVVNGNERGVAWINRVSGTTKTAAEAQAIVDGKVEQAQTTWDTWASSLTVEQQGVSPRPEKYTLP